MALPRTPVLQELIRRRLHWLNGAALAGSAVFSYPGRDYVLVGLMLFLPLLDRGWRPPRLPLPRRDILIILALAAASIGLLAWQPGLRAYAVSTLLLAALPEEWFFRGYLLQRLGGDTRANLISSLLFSLVHGLTRGWLNALLVFAPSLAFGWIFRKTGNLALVTLVHAFSNLLLAVAMAPR